MVVEYRSRVFIAAMFAALASILQLIEVFVILPIPFFKIGLANAIVLFFIYKKEYLTAFLINIIRLFIGNLFSGKLFTLPSLFSFSGGIVSLFVMILLYLIIGKNISITIISIFGALTHNFTQLILFFIIMDKSIKLSTLSSMLVLFSIIAGVIVAYFAHQLSKINVEFEKIE